MPIQFDAESRRRGQEAREESRRSAKNIDKLTQNLLPGLSPDILPKVVERLKNMPPHHRNRYVEAMQGKSRSTAIESHCWECMGYETHPRDCTSPACSLYPYRPQ